MTALLAMMFGGLFISTSNQKYNDAFKATADANYRSSELKTYVDSASDRIRKDQPVLSFAAGTGYTIATKGTVNLRTNKIIPVGGMDTALVASHNTGKIEFKFNF